MLKNQFEFWESLAKGDPDSVVIDPSDKTGYKNRYIVGIRNKVIYEQVKALGRNKVVLDFGCGSGLTTEYLYNKKIRVLGIDISFTLLSRAHTRVKGNKLPVFQYDGARIPIDTCAVDSIVTYVVLNHLTNREKLIDALHEMKRILKDDGKIIAVEQTRRKIKLSKDGSKKQLSIKEFNNIFNSSGFSAESTKVFRYGHFPFIYLIRTGLIKEKWFSKISYVEAQIGKIYKVPVFDYVDTIFILKKNK